MIEKDLFLNTKVYHPEKPLNNTNQQNFRHNYLSTFIMNQIEQNNDIHLSIDKVIETVNRNQLSQEKKMDQLLNENQLQKEQADFINKKMDSHGKTTDQMLHSLNNLQQNHSLLQENLLNEQLLNQAILDQLTFQDQQLRESNSQLKHYVTLAEQLSEQLINQEKLLKEMEQKLEIQDVYHSTVMTKLDKQDAMNEKIIRQLDHLKSIIFERVNLIVEKVENSYQTTTEFFHGIFNKTGISKPFLLSSRTKEKKDEKQEENNKIN